MSRDTFRKIIVTDETLENINPENKKLQDRFLKHKKLNVSATTAKGYSSDLDIFFSWVYLENENKFFVDLKKYDYIDFFSFAKDELQWGSSRANRMRSTLSSLSQYIERVEDDRYEGFRNLVLGVIDSAPKEERREKSIFTEDEVQNILDYFSKEDKQIACFVALAAFSGMRISELLRVQVSTIMEATDAFEGIFLYTHPIRSKGRGGNRKDNKYILKKEFMPFFDAWMKERTSILEKLGIAESDDLFIKPDGSKAVKGTARSWGRQINKITDKPYYFHSMRHALVTRLSMKGIPSNLIQALLSWKSSAMVEIYDDSTVHDKEWSELDALK